MKKSRVLIGAGAALIATTLFVAGPASASGGGNFQPTGLGTPTTVAGDLVSPLSLEVDRKGVSYVTQNFAGVLTKILPNGDTSVVASAPGQEISAVSSLFGAVFYAVTAQDHSSSVLMAMRNGKSAQVADLAAYEKRVNPDRVNSYGFIGMPQWCQDLFAEPGPETPPAAYTGIIDTHPYASLALPIGVYIADAGANAILRVGLNGSVSTVAVLPPGDPIMVTPELAAGAGFPSCAAGYNYRFEPVPTDVEIGPDGWLYVTTLPGGPEDSSLGARGSIYKVNPLSKKVVKVASGFVGATGLAVSLTSTKIAVAELFGGPNGTGQISVVDRRTGASSPVIALSSPSAIEVRNNKLYVTTDSFVPDATGAPQPIGKLTVVPVLGGGAKHIEDSSGD